MICSHTIPRCAKNANCIVQLSGNRHENFATRKRSQRVIHRYSCAQSSEREQKAKKSRTDDRARDTRRMERFSCDGWLHLAVEPGSNVMEVTLKHHEVHKAYEDKRLPEKWKEYIEQHARTKTPGQVCY